MATDEGAGSYQATNPAAITAGSMVVLQNQKAARNHGALPHNQFIMNNENSTCTLFIFLDNASDLTTPSFILFPNQQIAVMAQDGYKFETLFVLNTHATDQLEIGELTHHISTKRGPN